ncbi:transcriptional regulator [Corynebacterium suranareeae]|uniref:Transcriptional regulator n=1 Tax=Corynebacterium suranareeae TaxID=2506452 RepID=A0A161J7U8_9CORY|nr:MarR family transcriptional regulator [Corynebacterium suranareeae]BAU94372.1 transcriptional regulator [Corynebacterium suranareeae]
MTVNSESFEYWDFVRSSRAKLSEELSGIDISPNDLAMILNRASGVATGVSEAEVHRPKGMGWNAFKVLFILWMEGDLEQHRVAMLAGTSRATTSSIVKSLVSAGYVEQTPSTIDKRTHVLSLTLSGAELIKESYLEQNDILSSWNRRLTKTEQEILKMLLLKLLRGDE